MAVGGPNADGFTVNDLAGGRLAVNFTSESLGGDDFDFGLGENGDLAVGDIIIRVRVVAERLDETGMVGLGIIVKGQLLVNERLHDIIQVETSATLGVRQVDDCGSFHAIEVRQGLGTVGEPLVERLARRSRRSGGCNGCEETEKSKGKSLDHGSSSVC